ncbi:hypothetical protein AB3X91_11815 [Paraburkholderia sp. BR14263]|uniref:hypothetical protein n=1 Tax=unclassified Paraburkholderia TaxID=2615204 RepID=UPI0034CFD7F8
MLDISFKSNVDVISRQLSALAYKQLPFAEARAATELAKLAATAEKAAIPAVFEKATPFTVNSVGVQAARKELPIARVYIKDKAAEYLVPYEFGGTQFVGKKPGDLVPVGAAANQYGNLPRNLIRRYLNRKDCFLGTVKTARGDVFGLWQRPTPTAPATNRRRKKVAMENTTGKLKLLVAIHAPVATKKRLKFGDRAQSVVAANFSRVFGAELAKAIARTRG